MASEKTAEPPVPPGPGPFFALGEGPLPGSAVPLAEVYGGDSAALRARLDTVAARLGTAEARVAASIAYQGLASRLWSVALVSAVLLGRLPDLGPDRLRWAQDLAAPDDLWLPEPRPGPVAPGPEELWEVVHRGHLAPLAEAVRREAPVAAGLLRGNSASALAGSARMLIGWAAGAGRVAEAGAARTLASALLSRPETAGAGTWNGSAYRRASCCLYYRTPAGGLCGDCLFSRPPGAARGR